MVMALAETTMTELPRCVTVVAAVEARWAVEGCTACCTACHNVQIINGWLCAGERVS